MYRKLPLYFLISGSPTMGNESFEAIWNGMLALKDTLMKDPYAIETLYVSVIQASSDAWTIDPLTEISYWRPPLLFPEGTGELSLGAAFRILDYRITQEVIPASSDFQGDWCPLIFIMVSNPPTDDWIDVTRTVLSRKSPHIANCMTVLVGPDVKPSDFDQVPGLNPMIVTTSGNIKQFFRWVDQ